MGEPHLKRSVLLLALVVFAPFAGAQTNALPGTNAFYAGYTLAQPDATDPAPASP